MEFRPQFYALRVDKTVVLFDGMCNLCNGAVQFILRHDSKGQFRFASQQSEAGQRLLAQHGVPASDALADRIVVIEGDKVWLQTEGASRKGIADSIVVIEGDRSWLESDAALHILHRLGGAWSFFYIFRWLPKPFRDAVYRWVARNRYRIFGKRENCMVPTPELRNRFLQ